MLNGLMYHGLKQSVVKVSEQEFTWFKAHFVPNLKMLLASLLIVVNTGRLHNDVLCSQL